MKKLTAVESEMMQTLIYIKDAKKNEDLHYGESQIKNNMMQYFAGLAKAALLTTGKTYMWGFNGSFYHLVRIANGKEEDIATI